MNILPSWCRSFPPAPRGTLRALAALGLAAALHPPGAPAAEPATPTFFVATNGNDAWSGTQPAPAPGRADGPFATLTRARDAVRAWKAQAGRVASGPVRVRIQSGRYHLAEPLVFTPEDSGPGQGRVEYEGAGNEATVLSGGRSIGGWKETTNAGRRLWAASLPEVREGRWFFRQLWVNGQRRPRARHPNQGYLAVEAIPDAQNATPWSEGQARFRYKAGDLKAWPTAAEAEVRVMNRWVESHLPVVAVNEAERLVSFGKRSVFKLDPGDLYYVEHAFELLDTPGEWFLERASGTLFYWPLPGEARETIDAIAPVLAQLVRFEGRPQAGQFVDRIGFANLTFAHTEWYFPGGFDRGQDKAEVWPPPKAEVGGFAQAAVGVPGAVRGDGLRQGRFQNCRWLHLGGYAVELARGCSSNVIRHCELGDLGAGGVKLGETAIRTTAGEQTFGNELTDCHIHDGGQIFHSAIGVWIGQSPGNRVEHNHIHDFYYSGISIGWTWGYGPALATNNAVEWNHVHHIGVKSNGDGPILSDMAGIYTLGLQDGSVIRNNLWHDMAGLRYGGWGIYFDEGTTHILAENNVVYRTTHGGFHQHYGKENRVRNNVFAFAREHQVQRTRPEPHLSFTFERNLVVWDRGVLFGGDYSGSNYLFRSNVYWRTDGGDVRFPKGSLEQWRQSGQDTNSVVADPRFLDPHRLELGIAADSPARSLGFQPIDLKAVGVRTRSE